MTFSIRIVRPDAEPYNMALEAINWTEAACAVIERFPHHAPEGSTIYAFSKGQPAEDAFRQYVTRKE